MTRHYQTLSKKKLQEMQLMSVKSRVSRRKSRDKAIIQLRESSMYSVKELAEMYYMTPNAIYQIIRRRDV